jgi:glucuronate isomerase
MIFFSMNQSIIYTMQFSKIVVTDYVRRRQCSLLSAMRQQTQIKYDYTITTTRKEKKSFCFCGESLT